LSGNKVHILARYDTPNESGSNWDLPLGVIPHTLDIPFRPINRLKPIFNEIILEEQFGLLQKIQIHDTMVITQEALYSVHLDKHAITILKIDLSKAYARVSWFFLQLLLIKMGMDLLVVNWIMGCVQSTSFAILINVAPSRFFRTSKGLRKGYPLAPFLVLIFLEVLIKLIEDKRLKGYLSGVKVAGQESICHILFIDEILCFINGTTNDTGALRGVLDLFCMCIGMQINVDKSCLIINEILNDLPQ
jgi:hypothetical protein